MGWFVWLPHIFIRRLIMRKTYKPCPFCGSNNIQFEDSVYCGALRCMNCGARGGFATSFDKEGWHEKAEKMWNTRKED